MSDNDLCPRCNASFHCGVGDAAPCACVAVTLDATALADLRARYTRCVCLRCLVELAGAREKAGLVSRPAGF